VTFLMNAESPTKFFAKTTDVQLEFQFSETNKVGLLSVGEGAMRITRLR
jgi:hypothetical protein